MNTTMQERVKHYRADPEYAAKANAKYAELLARSAVDEDFRKRLLTEPRAALSEFAGHEIADSVNIKFVENDADATIVLPDRVDANATLSEQELETVGGGSDVAGVDIALTATLVYYAAAGAYDQAKAYVQNQGQKLVQ